MSYCRHGVTIALFLFLFNGTASGQDAAARRLPPGWTVGPCVGRLGTRARISVPDGFVFLDGAATQKFLTENENIPGGDEVGAVLRYRSRDDTWFVIFSYDDSGHVDDSDRDQLDADALLRSIKKGTERANAERRKRGWGTMEVVGWQQPPFYDKATNNLTWAIRGVPGAGGAEVVNRSVRLLGRTGVMRAQLVVDGARADATTAEFDEVLTGYAFEAGSRYAEFMRGDKAAGYGLSALVGAGAAGVAIKSGLLQKFWKLIVVGVVGLIGAVRRFFSKLFRKRERYEPVEPERWLPKTMTQPPANIPGQRG